MDYRFELQKLSECFVSHAEMEYLYDPSENDSGFIDPNALSAGGFPFVFRAILEQIQLKGNIEEIERARLRETFKIAFPNLAKSELYILTDTAVETLTSMGLEGNLVIFCGEIISKATLLIELYKKDFFKRLKALFSTPHGISWILPSFWKRYRIQKVKKFKEAAKKAKSIKFFSKKVIATVFDYMESFVRVLGVVKGNNYTTYDVEWESDMSYFIAESFEARGIHTRVLIDLHANSGLFSEIPLQSICAPYGSSLLKEVYQTLVHPDEKSITELRVYLRKAPISIEARGNDKKIAVGTEREIDITKLVVMTGETVCDEFKQYAYLLEHYDHTLIQKSNESHRKMYLANLLNAKSAFFTIFEKSEKELGEKIAYPKTLVCTNRVAQTELSGFAQKVTVKEGGWCSTGGKQVDTVLREQVDEFFKKCRYEGVVIQNYVPSILFNLGGAPMHGHVRKSSIITRKGVVVDAGFVLKLIEQDKGNSSGYRSHILYFDESGRFIFGKEIGGTNLVYTRLEQAGLTPAVNLQALFEQVKSEWIKAMYAVNKFTSERNVYDFARELAKSGKLSKRYILS